MKTSPQVQRLQQEHRFREKFAQVELEQERRKFKSMMRHQLILYGVLMMLIFITAMLDHMSRRQMAQGEVELKTGVSRAFEWKTERAGSSR